MNQYESATSEDARKNQKLKGFEMEIQDKENKIKELMAEISQIKKNLAAEKENNLYLNQQCTKLMGDSSLEYKNKDLEISHLKKRIKELETEKRNTEEGFSVELKKLLNLNTQQIDMLKDENKELDRKIMQEINKRHEEDERWRLKEHKLLEEIQSLELNAKKQKQSKNKPSNSSVENEKERQLTKKNHEIIDLTSEINELTNKLYTTQAQNDSLTRKIKLLEEDNQFDKNKNTQLLDKIKYYQTLESMQEKTDFEIVKELNDLRENVLILKNERDKILKLLNENGLDIQSNFNGISSEAFLEYIKRLTLDKKNLGEDLVDKEENISNMSNKIFSLESRQNIIEEEKKHLREENARLLTE